LGRAKNHDTTATINYQREAQPRNGPQQVLRGVTAEAAEQNDREEIGERYHPTVP
jgi:hypothetical protein